MPILEHHPEKLPLEAREKVSEMLKEKYKRKVVYKNPKPQWRPWTAKECREIQTSMEKGFDSYAKQIYKTLNQPSKARFLK